VKSLALILLQFTLLLAAPTIAVADQLRPFRFEGAYIFHMNNSVLAEYVIPIDTSRSLGFDLSASYGIPDVLNSVGAGLTYYPFSGVGSGAFANLSAIYGFALPTVQGRDGVDLRTSLMAGYRIIVLDVVTGSAAVSANYDFQSGNSGSLVKGLNWGFTVSLGLAF